MFGEIVGLSVIGCVFTHEILGSEPCNVGSTYVFSFSKSTLPGAYFSGCIGRHLLYRVGRGFVL